MNCSTCKWWGSEDWKYYTPEGDGGLACSCPKLKGDFDRADQGGEPLEPDGLAVGQSEFWLPIVTGPQFGCVHYAEAPQENTGLTTQIEAT
jgi:hypothetical protein